jgi:hypothetical protein
MDWNATNYDPLANLADRSCNRDLCALDRHDCHPAANCTALETETACAHEHGCNWEGGHCVDVFSVSTALTYAADKVGGYWLSTQGPGENVSWAVVGKAVANATCVNAAVNEVVDRAGAAACRKQLQCPGDGSYPRDGEVSQSRLLLSLTSSSPHPHLISPHPHRITLQERNCWVQCFASTVIGSEKYPAVRWDQAPAAGVSQVALVAAFEAGFSSCAVA